MRWPLANPVMPTGTRKFGWRIHPTKGTRNHHDGADFANSSGSPLLAIEGGRVTANLSVAQNPGGGNYIQITLADGYRVRYFHMQAQSPLRAGTVVHEGQVLGALGNTGSWTTGPHLHLEVREPDGTPIDPVQFIRTRLSITAPGQVSQPSTPIPSAPSIPQEDTLSAAEVTQIKNFITEMTEAVDPRPRLYKHASTKQEMAISIPQRYVRVMKNVTDRNNLIELGIISPAAPIVVNDGTYRGLKAEASSPLPE